MIHYQKENIGGHCDFRSNPHRDYVMPPHIHEYAELAFTYEGTTTVYIDGVLYAIEPLHAILIAPNQIHAYSDETSSLMRCAVFSGDLIPLVLAKLQGGVPADPIGDFTQCPQILQALGDVCKKDALRVSGLLNLILAHILRDKPLLPRPNADGTLLGKAIRYLSENFQNDVSLRILAADLGYHEKYLSSALHRATGMNFRALLGYYRIEHAKKLLRNTSLSVTAVALDSGYPSVNSFNRQFRNLTGTTPSKYRAEK